MMKYVRAFIREYVFGDGIPLEGRLVNMICLVGVCVATLNLLEQIVMRGFNLVVICAILSIICSATILMYLANRFRKFTQCIWATIFIICDVIFPCLFFYLGGANSVIPIYFVLSIALILLLVRGKSCIFLLVTHLALIAACYLISYHFPRSPEDAVPSGRMLDQFMTVILAGICLGLFGLFQSKVTSRESEKVQKANRFLAREQRKSKALLEGNPHFSVMLDENFRVLDCNSASIEFLGFSSKEELIEKGLEKLSSLIPEYQSDGRRSYSLIERFATFSGKDVIRFDTDFLVSGKLITMSVTINKIPYGDGIAFVCNLVDVTDLYIAQKELLHRESLLRTVNETAEILIASDSNKPDESLKRSMEKIGQCMNLDRIYIWKNRTINGVRHYVQEFEWVAPDADMTCTVKGRTGVPYIENIPEWEVKFSRGEIVNGPIRDMNQEVRERISIFGMKSVLVIPVSLRGLFWGFVSFDDCRRERTLSQEDVSILKSGSLLMANSMLRNEMMKNLIHAREAALSGARAKGDFLANMSHEIRTPLNAVIGMTAIGKNSTEMERKNYSFEKIEEASTHLLGVINDILDMSKIEANKLELSSVEFDFEKMLQRVVNVIAFRIDERRQKFTVYIDNRIPDFLIGDDQRLAQVITNLLSNAVKFTPEEGAIHLAAYLEDEKKEFCTVRIEVTDTGIGISEEQQNRLFNSFQQADSSTSRNFGGTGLGLAISKRIVEMMYGRIQVESEPDKGSKFIFTIRARRGNRASKNFLSADVRRKDLRILAVDDAKDVREYFSEIALRVGFTCDLAAGGEEALAMIAEKGSYNIYFIDWMMPGMSGSELTRKIRAVDPGESIITIISSSEWESIETEARNAGADKFLPKPLFPSAIADLINECLGGGAVAEAANHKDGAKDCFAGHCVLLAEDVEINREVVFALLEPTGIAVEVAVNGREAVDMYRKNPEQFDLILMDVQMPEMDGYEATRRIRALGTPGAKNIPIIAMTANVFREDVERCMEAGMNAHVGKPLDFDDVMSQLRDFLPESKIIVINK